MRLRPETADLLAAQAARFGLRLDEHLARLAEHAAGQDRPNQAIEQEIRRLTDRTPEQVVADRERIMAASRPPRPLPPGKTLADVVVGSWPGDETDEQVRKALEELS